jgi:hypothetical protein
MHHLKFFYQSAAQLNEGYNLLDILVEDTLYPQFIDVEIRSPFLLPAGDLTRVFFPAKECLLANILTAFAPHTTGIRFGIGKDLDIAKQLFDGAILFDQSADMGLVAEAYARIAAQELSYRGFDDLSCQDVLLDYFETACNLGMYGARA